MHAACCSPRNRYSPEMFEALSCALADDGVLVTQFGKAMETGNPNEVRRLGFKQQVMDSIGRHFSSGVLPYYVYIPSYHGEWTFVVGCKTAVCAERWRSSPGENDAAITARLDPGHRLQFLTGDVLATLHSESWVSFAPR